MQMKTTLNIIPIAVAFFVLNASDSASEKSTYTFERGYPTGNTAADVYHAT